MQRFAAWTDLGSVSLGPTDLERVIAPVTLVPGADTLWVRITQLGGQNPWPWSYGIASFQNSEGRPFGSVKAYGHPQGEVVRLGVGLPAASLDGSLVFEPRSFNLAWIKKGNPWNLQFEVRSGVTQGSSSGGRTSVTYPATDRVKALNWLLALPSSLARIDFR